MLQSADIATKGVHCYAKALRVFTPPRTLSKVLKWPDALDRKKVLQTFSNLFPDVDSDEQLTTAGLDKPPSDPVPDPTDEATQSAGGDNGETQGTNAGGEEEGGQY